ncbi:DYW domain [Dillenia turbinata]|uniref:DYW domain n=1 Tax=Dillenia turbinata TaxID=194707 RepID=A0AAN8ZN64_9MAGN
MNTSTAAVFGSSTLFSTEPNSNYVVFSRRKNIISLLQKCKNHKQILQVQAQIIKSKNEQDPFIVFELLRLCFRFKSTDYAYKVFQNTQNPNVYLYTALIDGLVLSNSYVDAMWAYSKMVSEDVVPDNYALTPVLKACGLQLALKEGREVHGRVLKLGLSSNRSVKLKLLELYGKCGEFNDAKKVFDKMPEQDVVPWTVVISSYLDYGLVGEANAIFDETRNKDTVCWTAMIDGLVRNGEMNRALEFFREMQRESVRPNEVTLVCVLSACSHLGALELGRWVHSYVGKYAFEVNSILGSSLINMYSRCGSIDEAQSVFVRMKEKDVSAYNSIIVGFAMNGRSTEAIEKFKEMIRCGLQPSRITFVGLLNACSHGGLVDLAFKMLNAMTIEYGIEPQIEHYGCVVDLLGRLGRLEEAYKFIEELNIGPDHKMWSSLLSACKIHGNLQLGERVAKVLFDLGNADSGTYVLLSNVYASLGKWEEAAQVRAKMKESQMQKEPGCSSIEVKNEIHEFFVGDFRHPKSEDIYRKLDEINQMLRSRGYSAATEVALQDIGDPEKEWSLAIHSERLAICYGLISTEPGTTLRVIKNLRVCNDCHSMIKLVAKVTHRKIVVRDRNRFHHFENGACSCGDYW